jgi:hypothetical protein
MQYPSIYTRLNLTYLTVTKQKQKQQKAVNDHINPTLRYTFVCKQTIMLIRLLFRLSNSSATA